MASSRAKSMPPVARHLGAQVWNFRKDRVDYRIYVTDARGIVVYDSARRDVGRDYSKWNDVYRTLRGRYGARSSSGESGDDHDTVMHVAAPVHDGDGRIIGVLGVAKPNRTTQPFIVASQREILRKGGVLLLLATIVGVAMPTWLGVASAGSTRMRRRWAPASGCRRHRLAAMRSATSGACSKGCARSLTARSTWNSTYSR